MSGCRPVSAAVDVIVARHGDLGHPDPPLRRAAWDAFTSDLRAFLTDVSLVAAMGTEELTRYAFHHANRSLSAGGDGGEWWALLVAYGGPPE